MMQYKWKILAIAWFVNFSMWAGDVLPAVLRDSISSSLHISAEYYSFLLSLPILMMVIFSIPVGVMVTKVGTKKTATLGMLITLCAGALRGVAGNLLEFTFLTAVYGVGMAVIFPNLPKIAEAEFSKKEQALASGIYMSGLPAGAIVALIAGAILSEYVGWDICFIVYALFFVPVIPLWMKVAKDVSFKIDVRKGFSVVAKNPYLWLVSVANLTLLITYFGATTYLPSQEQLIERLGALAPVIVASISASLICGLLFLPRLSQKIGEKRAAILYQLATAIFIYIFGWCVVSGTSLVWLFSLLTGFFIGGTIPLFFAFLSKINIDTRYFGMASGIFVSVLNIGGFLAPIIAQMMDSQMGIYGVVLSFSLASVAGALLTACVKIEKSF